MSTALQTGQDFWRSVLFGGGRTTIPRWCTQPAAGAAECRLALPSELTRTVRRQARRAGVSGNGVLLAAHAVVLAALSGDAQVVAGYRAPNGEILPAAVDTATDSWPRLLSETEALRLELCEHQDFPLDRLRAELDAPGPMFETAQAGHDPGELPDGVVLCVWPDDVAGVLGMRYRTDVLDARAADRVLDYHRSALRHLATEPHSPPQRNPLVSADELRHQLAHFSGQQRDLPDQRFHELFEARVRRHPDAIAAADGQRRWTYDELNRRANRIARALRRRGIGTDDVVAVLADRDLPWLASILAVFKAGGAYLPIEPHFPAERIATMLTRADCRWVLAEPGCAAALDDALPVSPGTTRLWIDAAHAEGHPEDDLRLPVAADQLAYVYFTSGSTGEPKGAMCEQAGMLNHLHAKIDALELDEHSVVAQVAPQCFDISLWQLLAPLLVGGRTFLVAQRDVLDVERFLNVLTTEHITVFQVVPSYLDVLLSTLESTSGELPDLRRVCATGEALKRALIARWFAAQPTVPLVNAYGLTETSDDTHHHVMRAAPADDHVPVGLAIPNVEISLVDDDLQPVPLGAPGRIAFSGLCLGRGYINDPDRTAQSFPPHPRRPGDRLHLGGDYGRWHADGTLEFLGRRDGQVKIAGFRIELGEIENRLSALPGVRDSAVVVVHAPGRNPSLAGFCSGDVPIDDRQLRTHLHAVLPDHMVPASLHWLPRLPLTANGKIDRAALRGRTEPDAQPEQSPETPSTETERRIAEVWSEVLGVRIDQLRRHDDFFARGGTSLSAVHVTLRLRRAISPRDIAEHPVLHELAAVLADREPAVEQHREDPS